MAARRALLVFALVALAVPLGARAGESIVVVVPNDMTVEATGPQGAIVTFTASAHRGTRQLTVTCSPPSGSQFAIRRTTVDCWATDQGETVHNFFHITVRDTSGPVLSVPASMTVEATSEQGALVTYSVSANDLVDGARPVACTNASGATYPFGATRVTCSSSDTRGNQRSASFTITVADRTPPVITVPAGMRVTTGTPAGATVRYEPTAVDRVDGPVAVVCAPPSGSHFAVGSKKVLCTAADRRGNVTSKTFVVTVVFSNRAALGLAILSPRAGALVATPPLLRWRKARHASFYNLQVFRHGRKVLSVWPTRTRFRLHARWTFNGRSYSLKPGSYTWFVWPAFGQTSSPRFGKLLGMSSFVVVKRPRARRSSARATPRG